MKSFIHFLVKFLTYFGKFLCYLWGNLTLLYICQILNNNLVIWSHCSRMMAASTASASLALENGHTLSRHEIDRGKSLGGGGVNCSLRPSLGKCETLLKRDFVNAIVWLYKRVLSMGGITAIVSKGRGDDKICFYKAPLSPTLMAFTGVTNAYGSSP